MGSSKKSKDKDREKKRKRRDRSRSKSKERERRHRHHHHHHKHKKHKRVREARSRSKSLSISDLSLSDSDFQVAKKSSHQGLQNEESHYPPEPAYPLIPISPPRQEEEAVPVPVEEISLSIEETNKLRAKIGLKPLAVSSSVVTEEPTTDASYVAGLEVHKPAENLRDKIQVEKLREKIAAQREKRRLKEKLKRVKTLGDESGDEDVTAWVQKSRKGEKDRLEAEKRNKMLEELDAQFGIGDIVDEEIKLEKKKLYASKNLSGMKVMHDAARFSDGASTILTLKDSNILDADEDTLVNINIMDLEHAEKNIKNRLKKKDEKDGADDPFDMSESDVLTKYDTEIEGERKKSFRLGSRGEGLAPELSATEKKAQKVAKLREMTSLDTPSYQLATEYMTENEAVSFKKVKKKKKKRMLKADDLLPLEDNFNHLGRRGHSNESNVKNGFGRRRIHDGNHDVMTGNTLRELMEEEDEGNKEETMEVEEEKEASESEHDDFELQEAITRSRRAKLSRIHLDPAEHLTNIFDSFNGDVKPSVNAIDLLKPHPNIDDNENMTLNITDEFCRTLGDIPTYGLSGNRDEEDVVMIQDDPAESNSTWDKQAGAWEEVGIDDSKVEINNEKFMPILEEEPDTGRGVVNALKLAMKKGYLDKNQSKKTSNAALQHLKAINYSIDDKVVDEDRSRGGGGRGEHRYTGPTMDFKEKDSYKPDVKLDYVDDEGRKLSAKEAFRYLSHKFHGKGSSKNKLEKRMKKWEEDLLMKHMSSSDTPLQTLGRQREKQKSMGVPYLVLSGSKQEVLDVKK